VVLVDIPAGRSLGAGHMDRGTVGADDGRRMTQEVT
jgi:hypothetical protein